jgi:hypothetical protein
VLYRNGQKRAGTRGAGIKEGSERENKNVTAGGIREMIVKELIEELSKMPQDAEVVSAKDPEGAWTVLSKPVLTKYQELDICVIKEGY